MTIDILEALDANPRIVMVSFIGSFTLINLVLLLIERATSKKPANFVLSLINHIQKLTVSQKRILARMENYERTSSGEEITDKENAASSTPNKLQNPTAYFMDQPFREEVDSPTCWYLTKGGLCSTEGAYVVWNGKSAEVYCSTHCSRMSQRKVFRNMFKQRDKHRIPNEIKFNLLKG